MRFYRGRAMKHFVYNEMHKKQSQNLTENEVIKNEEPNQEKAPIKKTIKHKKFLWFVFILIVVLATIVFLNIIICDHLWIEQSNSATCIRNGVKVSVCYYCEKEKRENVESSKYYHQYKTIESTVDYETEKETKIEICEICYHKNTVVTDALYVFKHFRKEHLYGNYDIYYLDVKITKYAYQNKKYQKTFYAILSFYDENNVCVYKACSKQFRYDPVGGWKTHAIAIDRTQLPKYSYFKWSTSIVYPSGMGVQDH